MLKFDIYGRMGHFRKFFSTVTSLSYYFPPRNTVVGIIAAILGKARDSYYELFSEDRVGIAIQVLREPRKLLTSIDYIDIQNVDYNSLRGLKGIKPTKLEFIVPKDGEKIGYRVFVVSKDESLNSVLSELHSNLTNSTYVYPVSLGPAYCLAEIDEHHVVFQRNVKTKHLENNKLIKLQTVLPVGAAIIEPKLLEGKRVIFEETLPPNFGKDRKPQGGSKNYIFEANGKELDVEVRSGTVVFEVEEGSDTYGVFM